MNMIILLAAAITSFTWNEYIPENGLKYQISEKGEIHLDLAARGAKCGGDGNIWAKVPLYAKGTLDFDIMITRAPTIVGMGVFVSLYGVQVFWQDYCRDWRVYLSDTNYHREEGFHAEPPIHRRISLFTYSEWHHARISFDHPNDRVEFFMDDMSDPAFIVGDRSVWGAAEFMGGILAIGGMGCSESKVDIKNLTLTPVENVTNTEQPRTETLIFDGPVSEYYQASKRLAADHPRVYSLAGTRAVIFPKNEFKYSAMPGVETLAKTKRIVMVDAPAGPFNLLPQFILRDIEKAVKEGAELIVLAGPFTLGKGEFKGTAMERLLPEGALPENPFTAYDKPEILEHTVGKGKVKVFRGLKFTSDPATFAPTFDPWAKRIFELNKITPNTEPRENLERSFFYSLHETDKEKNLPRVLMIGDRLARAAYQKVQDKLRGRAVVTVWDSSYDMNRPEFDAMLDIYLRIHNYSLVFFSNGCETSLEPEEFEREFRRVVGEIRAIQPRTTKLAFSTVTPRISLRDQRAKQFNAIIRKIAAETKAELVCDIMANASAVTDNDFYSDGNCSGPAQMCFATAIAEQLSKIMPKEAMKIDNAVKKGAPTCTDYTYPIHPAIGGKENIEWSTFYAFHETDADRQLPRVLMVGDSITQSFYEEAARQLKGKANISVWVNSYSTLRPEYQALMKIFLRTEKYAIVHYNSNAHCGPSNEDWEKGLRESVAMIRAEQPQAKIVWVNSPLPRDRKPGQKGRYEDIANRVVGELRVEGTNDIQQLSTKLTPEFYHDEVHFEKPAQKMAADQAVSVILPLLKK